MKPLELPCPKCNATPGDPCVPHQIRSFSMICPTCDAGVRQRCKGKAGHHGTRMYDDPSDIKRGMTHRERSEAAALQTPRPPPVDREVLLEVTTRTERRWAQEKAERER